MGEANSVNPGGSRGQRRLKNLLLDRHFQLKYTGYLVAIALLLSFSLGLVLFRTSEEVIAQSEKNVTQGAQIVTLGREVVDESHKVSAVVRMNIVKDPVYQNNPDLLDAFNGDADQQDRRLQEQRARLEAQSRSLHDQAEALRRFQKTLLWSLVGILSALVVAIGLAGIVVTHKVAGPIFKMKRHLIDVTGGDLKVPSGLRKGDELVDFFTAFQSMVVSLRKSREEQLYELEQAQGFLGPEAPEPAQGALSRLRKSLESGLH